jgi:D-serine dehydratase
MDEQSRHKGVAAEPLSKEMIGPLNKGLGALEREVEASEITRMGWNLLREDLSLPAAVLYEEKMCHNLKWMQQFIQAYGMKLAPHGKTTMAPKLFARQLQAGAWGITLATAHQTRVAYEHGVRRVLMANQLVGRQNMAVIARMVEDEKFEYFCLVDSAENVEQLGAFFRSARQRLNVLLEIGVDGGRTGVRDRGQLETVLASLERWRNQVCLSGVELYEGVLDNEASIRTFLKRAREIASELARARRFDRSPFVLSGAGSAWYDVVAEEFSKANFGVPVELC